MIDTALISSEADNVSFITNILKGCRPSGITDKRKKSYKLVSLAVKNETTEIYDTNKRKVGNNQLSRGHLAIIIHQVKKRSTLLEDF